MKKLIITEEERMSIMKMYLTEQTTIWDSVQSAGSTGEGLKTKLESFPSNSKLKSPTEGALNFNEKGDSIAGLPAYVGAQLQMQYNQLADMKNVKSAANSLSAQFGFDLEFYLTTEPGVTDFTNKANSASYFTIKGTKLNNGTFQIFSRPTYTEKFAEVGFKSVKGVNISMKVSLAANMLFGNLDGWLGPDLRKNINTKLAEYGYPAIPNAIPYNTVQTV